MPRSYSTCRMSTGGRCPFRKPMSDNPQGGGETATAVEIEAYSSDSGSDSDGNSAPSPAKRQRTESDDSSDSDSNLNFRTCTGNFYQQAWNALGFKRPPTQNGIYPGGNFPNLDTNNLQHNPAGCITTHINNQPLYQLVFPFKTHPALSSLRPLFAAGLPRFPTRVTPLNSQ